MLTPQAIDPAHPFPFIPNKGFSLVFELRRESDDELLRALLMLPSMLRRFIRLPGKIARYISLENTIRLFFGQCSPAMSCSATARPRHPRFGHRNREEAEDLVVITKARSSSAAARGHPPQDRGGYPEGLHNLVRNAIACR